MDSELETIFAAQQLRLTTPRKAIFAVMQEHDQPMTAAAIAGQCTGIDRTSVYRTLELFVRLGIAQTVLSGWKQRYELASPFKSHHHHLTCNQCGKLIDIHSLPFERAVAKVANDYGFTAHEHTFEIRGICQDCATK